MMKKIACITFTDTAQLAEEICAGLDGEVEILTKRQICLAPDLETCDGIVFIASAGIAVRLFALRFSRIKSS